MTNQQIFNHPQLPQVTAQEIVQDYLAGAIKFNEKPKPRTTMKDLEAIYKPHLRKQPETEQQKMTTKDVEQAVEKRAIMEDKQPETASKQQEVTSNDAEQTTKLARFGERQKPRTTKKDLEAIYKCHLIKQPEIVSEQQKMATKDAEQADEMRSNMENKPESMSEQQKMVPNDAEQTTKLSRFGERQKHRTTKEELEAIYKRHLIKLPETELQEMTSEDLEQRFEVRAVKENTDPVAVLFSYICEKFNELSKEDQGRLMRQIDSLR